MTIVNFTLRWGLGFLFALMFLSLFFPLHATEPPGWEDLGLYGGQINAIAIDPVDPNIMFVGSYYGDGLFKSTDGGLTWQSVDGFRNEISNFRLRNCMYVTAENQNMKENWRGRSFFA